MRVSPALDLVFPPDAPGLIDLVTASLDDFGPAAIHETGPDDAPEWRVFFGERAIRDEALAALCKAFSPRGLVAATIDVPDEDWAARSQASLRAVRVGRVVVAPPWDVPRTGGDDVLVIVRPSMGFGTGHHETTRLCLALLQTIDCRGLSAVDVGTGSGVLALAAAGLGAASVDGIDHDPDAVANAEENVALNPSLARGTAVRFTLTDLRPAPVDETGRAGGRADVTRRADVVLANLTGALLVTAARDLLARAVHGGSLVLSGFQRHEAPAVLTAFAVDTDIVTRQVEGDWEAALLRRH